MKGSRVATVAGAIGVTGMLIVTSVIGTVFAQSHTLTSLASANFSLGNTPLSSPSINNRGQVAYVRRVNNESVIFIHDGISETEFFNLADAGFLQTTTVVLNDNGEVGVRVGSSLGVVNLLRISPDKTVTILATANDVNIGAGDFREIRTHFSMNNLGQFSVATINNDGTNSVVLIDEAGITEIARESATLTNFTEPSINDLGVVAFVARVPGLGGAFVFTGTGGLLTNEGRRGSGVLHALAPSINNNGLVLDRGDAPIYTAQGGIVQIIVSGDEDPVFAQIGPRRFQYDHNDLGNFVFASMASTVNPDFGVFTGNNPATDTIVRKDDIVFGGPVTDVQQTLVHSINNGNQIVFLLQVGTAVSHVVRADPTMVDNEPPTCDLAEASPSMLWPPDHSMARIGINGIGDPDGDFVTLTITSVTQDEPVNGPGDGNTVPDAVIENVGAAGSVLIRSERAGGGNGRVYRVNFQATDGIANCNGYVLVSVPHSKRSAAVDSGQNYVSTLP